MGRSGHLRPGLWGQSGSTAAAAVEEGTGPRPQSRRSSAHLGAVRSWTWTRLDLKSQGRTPALLPALQAILRPAPRSLLESLGAWSGTSLCPEPSTSSLQRADCQGFLERPAGSQNGPVGLRHHGVSLSPLSPGHNFISCKRGFLCFSKGSAQTWGSLCWKLLSRPQPQGHAAPLSWLATETYGPGV